MAYRYTFSMFNLVMFLCLLENKQPFKPIDNACFRNTSNVPRTQWLIKKRRVFFKQVDQKPLNEMISTF